MRLMVSGLPVGAKATFRPDRIRAGQTSVLRIHGSRSARTGRYVLRIRAVRLQVIAYAAAVRRTSSRPTRTVGGLQLPMFVSWGPRRHTPRTTTTTSSPTTSTTSTTNTTSTTSTTNTTNTSTTSTTNTSSTSSSPSSGSSTGSSDSSTGSSGSSTSSTTSSDPSGVPAHVPTWAYDDGCNGGSGASASLVDQWVTFAESSCGPNATKVQSDCANGACTAVQYLDANWIYSTGSVPVSSAASENWWLHQPGQSDSAHRLASSGYGGGNLLNQSNPAVDAWFQNYVQSHYNGYGALMMDDSSSSLSGETYASGYSSSQELTSDAAMQSAHEDMAAAMTHTDGSSFLQIDNALNPNPYLAMPFGMLGHPSGVRGLVSEGSPISNGSIISYYSTLLDELAYVDGTSNAFAVLLSYDSSGSSQARNVLTATDWLAYSGDHVVDWADLETNSNDLAVWPEEGIVPTSPVQSMGAPGGTGCLAGTGKVCTSGGHTSLQVAPGVYRREFAACYDQGSPIGPCAAIVNDTGSAVTVQSGWLTQSYAHQVTYSGGDVQSGGTVNLSGGTFHAGSTTVPADNAVLLSQ